MESLTVSINLENPEGRYLPGDTVSGSVTIRNIEPWDCRYVDVLLAWKTDGIGDEDSATVAITHLFTEGESVPPSTERPFTFTLPSLPWSYHGTLIKINWLVAAYAKPRRGLEASTQKEILVHPEPQDLRMGGMAPVEVE